MNRIIIIGNGFDLANGYKTSYKDFIYWYWSNLFKQLCKCKSCYYDDGLCRFFSKNKNIHCNQIIQEYKKNTIGTPMHRILTSQKDAKWAHAYISKFLIEISKEIEKKNWVDIEMEYYQQLVSDNIDITKLNQDLNIIKEKLAEYLLLEQKNKRQYNTDIEKLLFTPIHAYEIALHNQQVWKNFEKSRLKLTEEQILLLLHLNNQTTPISTMIKRAKEQEKNHVSFNCLKTKNDSDDPIQHFYYPDQTLFLNFNYTTIADNYMPIPHMGLVIINHIHGIITNPQHMIFGYGDDSGEKHKAILDKNNNEYLRNIKSIKYSEQPNYRKLLDFIESDAYQIFIMGHSCGTSDRTLLNTLFEHPNCVSIKPFYYIDKYGKDNYIDIVQNIHRNFDDMKLMRDKVVNKEYCQPLKNDSKESS